MTTLALGIRAIEKKIKSAHTVHINWKLILIVCTLFSLAMAIWYVVSIAKLTRGAYLIKNYTKEISTLSAQNSTFKANFAKSGFLGGVQDKALKLEFEKTSRVIYLNLRDNSLAKAK